MHFSVKNDFLKSFFEKYLHYSKFFVPLQRILEKRTKSV